MSWESCGREELPAHIFASYSRGGMRQMFSAFSVKHYKEFLAEGQKDLSSTLMMRLKPSQISHLKLNC